MEIEELINERDRLKSELESLRGDGGEINRSINEKNALVEELATLRADEGSIAELVNLKAQRWPNRRAHQY